VAKFALLEEFNPPANMPLVLEEQAPNAYRVTDKSPKSVALPSVPIVTWLITLVTLFVPLPAKTPRLATGLALLLDALYALGP
jgi:hypothetical protein